MLALCDFFPCYVQENRNLNEINKNLHVISNFFDCIIVALTASEIAR